MLREAKDDQVQPLKGQKMIDVVRYVPEFKNCINVQ